MGLPYTVHPVDVFGEAQFKPEFLRLNPNAKVPVITDQEGPGGKPYTLFESGAILIYLAEKTGQFLPKGHDRAVRCDSMDDGADDLNRPDVRAIHAFHALCAKGQRLRARPLPHTGAPGP
jgi:glutathione S-transferase